MSLLSNFIAYARFSNATHRSSLDCQIVNLGRLFSVNIQFQIVDIFHLSTGYTIFVGAFAEEIPTITSNYKYMATLIVDSSIYQKNIYITGEMIGGRHPERYRGITTLQKVDLSNEFITSHDCKLILVRRCFE